MSRILKEGMLSGGREWWKAYANDDNNKDILSMFCVVVVVDGSEEMEA